MDRFATIAALVDDAIARGVASAAAVSVGDVGMEVARLVVGRTRRLPDPGPPVDESSWFDVASLTKPMVTTALAMVLVGDGALDIASPIRHWIPEASSTGTVQELLGHAAGCAAHVEFFREMRAGSPDPRRELVERAAREPVIAAPGLESVYSDLGYLQLGAIVERAAGLPLEEAFASLVAGPLGLSARFAPAPLVGAVSTEIDEHRGLVTGLVHDENAYYGGRICGHAGLFATIKDVARFAAAIVDTHAGSPRGRLQTAIVQRFASTSAAAGSSWRLGWDTPSATPGVSHAGDRWPRAGAIGHLGFTGTSLWLDLPHRRWVALLTNRVHPTRDGTADAIKALRRAVHDAAVDMFA